MRARRQAGGGARRREGARLGGELVHGGDGHDEPAVGDARGPRDARRHLRAHQDGRPRPLERAGADGHAVERPVTAVMGDAVLGPQAADDLHALP